MSVDLILDAPRQRGTWSGPARPSAIVPGRYKPLEFEDLGGLARFIHRERRGHGLTLKRAVASYLGSSTFEALRVSWIEPDDVERYAFTVAIQGRPREALEAAIAAENPDQP